ncbi:MAG TPA: radical SAM protein [bacterium]|nr:radical SAM protein [bacterium]
MITPSTIVSTVRQGRKVLLCIPPPGDTLKGSAVGGLLKTATSLIPQGICHLASACRQAGYETRILDCQALEMSLEEAVNAVCLFNPDFVGISATTLSIIHASQFAREIKKRIPTVRIVVGGYHVSALPEETLKEFQSFDAGVVGEGERTLVELLDAWMASRALSGIAGLVFREETGIRVTPRRALIKDLDSLGLPAWDLLPRLSRHYGSSAQRYRVFPVASVITSRGCPHQCTFCDRSVFGTTFRGHSAEYVMAMIRTLRDEHGIRSIVFNDDLFIANKTRLTQICEAMIHENLRMSWSCDGRIDRLDDDLLKLMKRAGCWQLAVGIESGDDAILSRLNKGFTVEQARQAVVRMKGAGMSVKGFFVMGTPGETEQSLEQTVQLIKRLPLDEIQITLFTPFPGTDLFRAVVSQEGFTPRWDEMNTASVSYVPKGLTKGRLLHYQRQGYLQFYFRPRQVLYQLGKLKRPRFAVKMLREAFCFLQYALRRQTTQ